MHASQRTWQQTIAGESEQYARAAKDVTADPATAGDFLRERGDQAFAIDGDGKGRMDTGQQVRDVERGEGLPKYIESKPI